MTETERLRALLDEAGAGYKRGTGPANTETVTVWKGAHGRRCFAFEDQMEGGLRVQSVLTAEQAVGATLGRAGAALTARQVRETVDKHWHDLPDEYGMPEATALPGYGYDWHAIADELSALGRGEREWLPVESCHSFEGAGFECSACGHEEGDYGRERYSF